MSRPDSPEQDAELRGWMEDWQQGPEGPPPGLSEDARRKVQRRVRRWSVWIVLLTASEALLLVAMVGWAASLVWGETTPADTLLAAMVVVLVGGASAASWWNRRGTYRPAGETTIDYLDLEILRSRRKIFTSERLVPGFLAFEAVLFVPWLFFFRHDEPARALRGTAVLLVALLSMTAVGFVFGRRFRRELDEQLEMRRSLVGEDLEREAVD